MKKTTVTKFVRHALAIAKHTNRPALLWSHEKGRYTVATGHYLVQFWDTDTFDAIRVAAGEENMSHSDTLDQLAAGMIFPKEHEPVNLVNTGIWLDTGKGALLHFLTGERDSKTFSVAVNDAYLEIFGKPASILGSGSKNPVILTGGNFVAAIMPVNPDRKSIRNRLSQLADLYR